jgi:hypothetical protein
MAPQKINPEKRKFFDPAVVKTKETKWRKRKVAGLFLFEQNLVVP